MDEMNYEYLIRRAYQCGRYGVPGADADVYRALERRYIQNRDNTIPAQTSELLHKYAFACGEVATYMKMAIENFSEGYQQRFTDEQKEEIEDIETLLYYGIMESIEEALERAEALMLEYGIYPG